MLRTRAITTALVGFFAILLVLELGARVLTPARRPLTEHLKVQPKSDRIYLLGNSMFKTGFDMEAWPKYLPADQGIDLAYHDGHYTNLWYLILKNAIIPSEEKPRVLVWGFRPTFAYFPSFRKRARCDIEKFQDGKDATYERIAAEVRLSRTEAFHNGFSELSVLYALREGVGTRQVALLKHLGARSILYFKPAHAQAERLLNSPDVSVSDYLTYALSGGRVQSSAERVVDGGDRFVKGPKVGVSESFVPQIMRLLQEAGIPQLVVIFRPVSATGGGLDADAKQFTEDAISLFEKAGVPYVNLVDEDALTADAYGKGDHYNQKGRAIVTERVGRALSALVGSGK